MMKHFRMRSRKNCFYSKSLEDFGSKFQKEALKEEEDYQYIEKNSFFFFFFFFVYRVYGNVCRNGWGHFFAVLLNVLPN